jgi:hypothetical protein
MFEDIPLKELPFLRGGGVKESIEYLYDSAQDPRKTSRSRQRDDQLPVNTDSLVGLLDWRWIEVLASHRPVLQAPAGDPLTNGTLQAGTGEDLEEGAAEMKRRTDLFFGDYDC